MYIDEGCVPATGHSATLLIAPEYGPAQRRRDGLLCSGVQVGGGAAHLGFRADLAGGSWARRRDFFASGSAHVGVFAVCNGVFVGGARGKVTKMLRIALSHRDDVGAHGDEFAAGLLLADA